MKFRCDECNRIIWPRTSKMSVTPHDLKEGNKKIFHFDCWLTIAPKDLIYEFSKEFQKKERKQND